MTSNTYYGRQGTAYSATGEMYYRPDPNAVRREIASYMNSQRPMGGGERVGTVAGQELLKRLESGSIGPLCVMLASHPLTSQQGRDPPLRTRQGAARRARVDARDCRRAREDGGQGGCACLLLSAYEQR